MVSWVEGSGMLQNLDCVREWHPELFLKKSQCFNGLENIWRLFLVYVNQNWKPHQISSYKMCLYANHKMSFQFSLWVEETSKMQACKTFSSMHGQAWHFMYKKTIRKGSNMYKNHLRRQRSVWVTLNPNPAAANPCPRPPFTTLLLALLFLETMLPRKSRWLGIVYIHSIRDYGRDATLYITLRQACSM